MSLPAPGNYFIVNLAPTANFAVPQLAINFNGEGSPLTVTPYEKTSSQVWQISNFDSNTQTISPMNSPYLQVAFGSADHTLTTLPAGEYTWAINGNNGLYTIMDGGKSVHWDLKEFPASPGTEVTYSTEPADPTQYWWLYNA